MYLCAYVTSLVYRQFYRGSRAVQSLIGLDMNIINFPGYADFEWAVQLNRFSLKLLGLWPEEAASLQDRLNSNLRLFGVFILINGVCTVPSLHLLLKIWGDINAMMDNFVFTLPLLTVSVKLLILWWKREALSSLMTMIAHDWIKSKSKDERNVMIRCAQNARLIITFSYIVIFCSLIILIISTAFGYTVTHVTNITDTKKPLPLQGYYIYNTSVSPQFELTFFGQCISLTMVALSYTSTDNFLGLLVFHICGQLENLTSRLYQMRESKDFAMALRVNVTDHTRLIRSVAIIEDAFTLMLLFLFLYFGSMVCTYGFLVVTVIIEEKNVSIKKTIFLIMVICTAFTHMCVYCAVGELLIIKYEEVYNAVYEFEWYTLDTKKAKNFIFLLVRMNKPLYITAGKMLPMTMATFCSILKSSGGYISVLLANQN
ncbi:odorant receptor 43a-like isoform X2 [Ooceraea biroi]|uniref:odorant receptor 43a-like isoform X2 n=1 Tax=Ooceraea biroi TaxID=2015173 RepID=UPI0005BB7DB1|nr:odorant receptor 43a-like isoform X2 [Ooceraea biroi]